MGQSRIGGKEAWSFRDFLPPPVILSLEEVVVAWRMRGALTRDIEHFTEAGGLSWCVHRGDAPSGTEISPAPDPHMPTHPSLLDFTPV